MAVESVAILDVNDPAPFCGILITFEKHSNLLDCCDDAAESGN